MGLKFLLTWSSVGGCCGDSLDISRVSIMPSRALPLFLVVAMISLTCGEVFTPQQESDVIGFVDHLLNCRNIVGVTVGVVKGEETWTHGFGHSDRESGRNVTSSDLFGIGSITKSFTSALIAVLLNDTEYSWMTPVSEILGPDFRLATEELIRNVTLKDMLSHRTGLDGAEIPLFSGLKMTADQFLRNMEHLPVQKPFRDEMIYNNWVYGLAGHVAEKMGNSSWEDLIRRRLLVPLKMTQTRSNLWNEMVNDDGSHVATPYVLLGGELVISDPEVYKILQTTQTESSGAIASSAEDMVKWMKTLLNSGRTQSGLQLVSEASLTEMFSPIVTLPANYRRALDHLKPTFRHAFISAAYGFGFMTANYRGYDMLHHGGNFFPYTSFMAVVPALQLGVFVANNGPYGNGHESSILNQIFFYIADLVMRETPWLNISNGCQYPELWNPPGPRPSFKINVCNNSFVDPDRYIGHYHHSLFGDVEVERNETVGLRVSYGFLEGQLCRMDKNAENVALFEVLGKMAFLFRPKKEPLYLQLTFSLLNGTFQEVILSYKGGSSKVLYFKK